MYELWFKLLLHELGDARDRMLAGEDYRPRLRLQRAHAVERVLVEQVDVLETMTPQDFLAFRALLAPASGFQSVQFREIEFLSGAKDAAYLRRLAHANPAERDRLARRLAGADAVGRLRRAARQGRLRRDRRGHRAGRPCWRSAGTGRRYGAALGPRRGA